jgi:uncharacterized caspase-like protein
MKRYANIFLVFLAMLACLRSPTAGAAVPEKRLALVIGNASYKTKPLATAVNDAALIAQTLQLAGFDVSGARDLDQGLLRGAFRDFTTKVASAGTGAVVFVYFAGYGVQLAGENYLIPIGAEISDPADLPNRASSLSELMHALATLNPKSTFIVLDAARPGPVLFSGQAGGLAWTKPESGMLIAFSAAPGTLARDVVDGYGPYAKALAEMIREGELTPANLFDRVRLRVHEVTKGAQIPWDAFKIETPFKFFERTPGVPERSDAPARTAQFRLQPMRALGSQNAYMTALMRDTFDAYTDFLADYWQDSMTKRVRALLAARRESITWQQTCQANEPNAYWSYLERYPHGPHVVEAGRLLTQIGASTTPSSKFARIDYDAPAPLPDELEYIERPTLILDDPELGFEPPPPTPANFLGPAQEFLNRKPTSASAAHALPALNLPLQASLRVPPPDVEPPPNSSQGAREAWVMRSAVDVPAGPEKQAESFSISSPASNTANDRANETRVSAPFADGATRNKDPGPQTAGQDAATEMTSRLSTPSQVVSGAPPQWFNDLVNTRNRGSPLKTRLAASEFSMSATSMFAPAAAGLTFVPPLPESKGTSEPFVRSAALQPSQIGLPGEESAGAVLPPQMTTPQSSPTSQALPVASTSNISDSSEGTSGSTAPRRTAPTWLTDVLTTRNPGISPEIPIVDAQVPISAPSMFASASAGLTFQTWHYGIPSLRGNLRAPFARPAALARPRGVSEGQAPAILSPQPTGSIRRPTPRSAALTPPVTGSLSGATPNSAEPSSIAAGQAGPRKKPAMTNPVPPGRLTQDPDVPPPNPQ